MRRPALLTPASPRRPAGGVRRHSRRRAEKREDADAGPLVPVVELEPLRRDRQIAHVDADDERTDDGQRQQPVQGDGDAGITFGGGCGAHGAWGGGVMQWTAPVGGSFKRLSMFVVMFKNLGLKAGRRPLQWAFDRSGMGHRRATCSDATCNVRRQGKGRAGRPRSMRLAGCRRRQGSVSRPPLLAHGHATFVSLRREAKSDTMRA